jgi:hypothetical protein
MDQVSYFRGHPPRCLAGFNVRPTPLPGVKFDGHASVPQFKIDVSPGVTIEGPEHINPVFALSCRCGGSQHYIHGYRWINPDYHNAVVFLSPLFLECAICGKMTDLLDTDVHGYGAELGHGSATVRAVGDRIVFECPNCGRQSFDTFVRFEYSDDLFDRDFPEFTGREQELFSWFSLLVSKCPKYCQVLAVADFECA